MLPQTLLACLSAFEPCFTAPSYQRFTVMMSGWLLCVGKRTITGVMRSAGVADMHPAVSIASSARRYGHPTMWVV